MKTFTIIGAEKVERTKALAFGTFDLVIDGTDQMSVSDGYHTVEELYEHRIELWIKVCQFFLETTDGIGVWRSKLHSDGTNFDGWFLLGIKKEAGKQMTYHIPLERWEDTNFAQTLDKAPEFDGHTSQNVLERLKKL